MFERAPGAMTFTPIPPSSVRPGDLVATHALARQGAWRLVLDKTKHFLLTPGSSPGAGSPQWLAAKTYQIASLVKLRSHAAASEEMRALGDLDDPRYNTNADGSCATPFALRLIRADLPRLLGRMSESLDAHYALAERCSREANAAADEDEKTRWSRRRDCALHAAVNLHLGAKDHLAALARLDWLARRCASTAERAVVLSLAGRVHLHLGDVDGARMCFDAAAAAAGPVDEPRDDDDGYDYTRAQRAIDAGLLAFATKEYATGKKHFEDALRVSPRDPDAANNLAVAHVYVGDLAGGVKVLERAMTTDVTANAQKESLATNLCSMYELLAPEPVVAKRALAGWLGRVAPDDLDLTCTRL